MRIALSLVALITLAPGCGAGTSDLSEANVTIEKVASGDPAAGPVLHGDLVAWSEGGERDGAKRTPLFVVTAAPGKPRRIVYRQATSAARPSWWLDEFYGSPQLVSFVRRWEECSPPDRGSEIMCSGNHSDVIVIEADGRTEVLSPPAQCNAPREIDDFAAHGSTIAWVGTRCEQGVTETALWVDSLEERSPRLLESGIARLDIMLAGPFLARGKGGNGGRMSIVDLRSGKVFYEPWSSQEGSDHAQYDLAPDGALVVASKPEGAVFTRVMKYSADKPDGQRLDLPIRSDFEAPHRKMLQVGEGFIAFERQVGPRQSELVVADESGDSRVIAKFDEDTQRVGEFDFDGEQLTWAARHIVRLERECRYSSYAPPLCWSVPVGPITIYRARLGLD